ncbi:MAG: hypothetical protein M3518_11805 [Actinomycetota bacterium]|nr:hypothetical protein [Actinomycetota bacterium]
MLVSGKAATLEEGLQSARNSIDEGAAHEALEAFIKTTRHLARTGAA